MSAVYGLLRFDGRAVDPRDLQRMGQALAHRGPDGRDRMADGPLGLGHCLMRVNREDAFERQPLHDPQSGVTLVADCRIDNREELAAAFAFSPADAGGMPDSRFILEAYKKWGEDAPSHLIGDFVFALWDEGAKTLVIARDHVGQRYVNYHVGEGFFAFATEVKGLTALPVVPRGLSDAAIGHFLLHQRTPRAGATFFEGIAILPGGHTLTVRAGGAMELRRYWEPAADPSYLGMNEAGLVAACRRIAAEAVECRIRRLTAPPALLLSAGFDSGAIAGLCGPVLTAAGRKLIAVSSVLPEDYLGPLRSVRRWTEMCRRDMPYLDLHYFVRKDESLFANLERMFYTAEGPSIGLHHVRDAMYREAARAGARLLMDGLGGDDTINPRASSAAVYFLRRGDLGQFWRVLWAGVRAGDTGLPDVLRGIVAAFAPLWAKRAVRAVVRGFAPAWPESPVAAPFAAGLARAGTIDLDDVPGVPKPYQTPREARLRSLRNWIAAPRRNAGPETAAHGLELTRPFADKRVVEFGLAVPEKLYVKDGRGRYLTRAALRDVYPAEFQTRNQRQDALDPDLAGMLSASIPQLREELARMEDSRSLRPYIDFEKLKSNLEAVERKPALTVDAVTLFRTLHVARYIAWLRRDNI